MSDKPKISKKTAAVSATSLSNPYQRLLSPPPHKDRKARENEIKKSSGIPQKTNNQESSAAAQQREQNTARQTETTNVSKKPPSVQISSSSFPFTPTDKDENSTGDSKDSNPNSLGQPTTVNLASDVHEVELTVAPPLLANNAAFRGLQGL